jgi:N4-gp56 family major capsid protein
VSDTRVASALTVEQWDAKYFTEYLTKNRFTNEFGTSEGAMIQVKENLIKAQGDRINFALINKLSNDAVTGRGAMEGNEEDMSSRGFPVTVDMRRNAVVVHELDAKFSAIDLREGAKAVLMDWSKKDTETLIIQAMMSKNGTRYSSASEANKDAWLVDNRDRALFGKLYANSVSLDHSTSLATLDTTDDLFTPDAVSNMVDIAMTVANPIVRPLSSTEGSNGRVEYILYAHPYLFNDLKKNSAMQQAQREVVLEMENERLFKGGDLYWDGCVIKKMPQKNNDGTHEWDLGLVGSGGTTRVCGAFLCGAQAIGVAYAQRWNTHQKDFDYGVKHGVEVRSIYGVEKLRFETGSDGSGDYKDHGIVTGYFATAGLS